MKYFSILLIGFFLTNCNQPPTQPYYQPPQPQPQVVYVQQPDGTSIMMNYLLWRSLMDQGGQTQVNNYYYQHKNEPEFQPQRQQEYRQTYEREKVQTQKSQGFGSKPVETTKSNGFGSKPVETKRSSGFGYSTTTSTPKPSTSVSTQRSSGFGSRSSNSVSTNRSSGFGKKQ